jgi:hypothetical protein
LKLYRLLLLTTLMLPAVPAVSQQPQIDPNLRGFWKLNVEKSDFGGSGKLKMGLVNWTEHGWVFAIVTPDGNLYADGLTIDHGCTLIGVPSDFSCEIQVVTPQHVRLIMRRNGAVRRIGDIELIDQKTTKTTHHVTPEKGEPYVQTTIWEKLRD